MSHVGRRTNLINFNNLLVFVVVFGSSSPTSSAVATMTSTLVTRLQLQRSTTSRPSSTETPLSQLPTSTISMTTTAVSGTDSTLTTEAMESRPHRRRHDTARNGRNRKRHGGGRKRTKMAASRDDQHSERETSFLHPRLETDGGVECVARTIVTYLSDGFCTSAHPIRQIVCGQDGAANTCLPMERLPWYAEFIKVWSRSKTSQYRCVGDAFQRRRIKVQCADGETRRYRINLATSCRCKRHVEHLNRPSARTSKWRMAYRTSDVDDVTVNMNADDVRIRSGLPAQN